MEVKLYQIGKVCFVLCLIVSSMALGPFARIFAQVVVVAGGAVGRAFMNAYKEAAQRGAQQASQHSSISQLISRKMNAEEAMKILELENQKTKLSAEIIQERFKLVNSANISSPYLQSKINNAKIILEEQLQKQPKDL
jgi:homoserine dehydrogenase